MDIETECLFCFEEKGFCNCDNVEIQTKKAFLSFFVESMKEFSPKKAQKIKLYDAVDFVNEWFERYFSDL